MTLYELCHGPPDDCKIGRCEPNLWDWLDDWEVEEDAFCSGTESAKHDVKCKKNILDINNCQEKPMEASRPANDIELLRALLDALSIRYDGPRPDVADVEEWAQKQIMDARNDGFTSANCYTLALLKECNLTESYGPNGEDSPEDWAYRIANTILGDSR